MKKDAYYFPHFSNARHDRKLKRAIKELGVEAYGIYFMLLEVLRDQDGFSYPMEDIDLLADEFKTSEQKVRTVVCNYDLFQVNEFDHFFSLNFNEFMKPWITAKEQRRQAGIKSGEARRKKALLKENNERPLNDRSATVEQPLNKERKRKEKKQEDINNNFLPDSYEYRIADYLLIKIRSRNPDYKQPNMQTWSKQVDYILRIDKRPVDEVGKVIDFCQSDKFWQNNILSTKKLREKYDQLKMRMEQPKNEYVANGINPDTGLHKSRDPLLNFVNGGNDE